MRLHSLRITLGVFALSVFASSLSFAQISAQTGAITGTVLDPTGASVPNAKVTLTSPLGAASTVNTGTTGDYTFPLLAPGAYSLSVDAQGFNRYSVKNIIVEVTQTARVPIALTVGTAATEVSVTATAELINSTNATTGNTLPGNEVENLPLATRNFTNLLGYNAGTATALPNASTVGRASAAVYVNGQRGTANNLVINGIDANDLAANNFTTVPIPSPDSIEELRLQTSLYDASQGKTSGGNLNVITKSGDAHYHGSAYEFFRNEDLNANDFFFNKAGLSRPPLKQNQFGGNFGGPVFGAKHSTFFFLSYEGTKQVNGLSGAINTVFPVLPAGRTRAGIESAFGLAPGTLDPTALALLQAKGNFNGYFIPSGAGVPGTFGQLSVSAPVYFSDHQFNTNVDHQFGSNNRLALRYFSAPVGNQFDPLGGQAAGNLGSGLTSPLKNYLASMSDTWTITPRMYNEARIGFNRIVNAATSVEPVKLSDVGMTRFNGALYPGVPLLLTNDIGPSFGGESTNYDQAGASNTIDVSDTLAYIQGKHNFRFGFVGRFYQVNTFNNFASRGYLQFNTFKDYLTGNILRAFVGTGQTARDFRAHDLSGFVQDDWKITPRLTLNLGLRYDYLGPSYDKRNRVGNFDSTLLDAQTLATGGAGLLNGFVIPADANFGSIKGTPGASRSTLTEANDLNFAPRVGFAFDPTGSGKTSIRGGYGIYYVRISNQTLLQLLTAAPFFQLSAVNNPGTPFSNPFPALPVPSQFPILPAFPQFTGFNAAGTPQFSAPSLALNPIQRNLRTPYAEHYNFSLDRKLGPDTSVEAGYIGSQGVKLLDSLQVNQALLANDQSPIRGLTANSSRNASARVLVPGFSTTGLNMVTNAGHSSYNAFVATVTRRAGNMYLQGAYTFSKSLDNNSGSAAQDLGNSGGNALAPQLLRGLSGFDRTHRFQATYRYELPWFKSGMMRYALGNWSVGGITTYQSALPINFSCSCGSDNVYGITTTIYPQVIGNFAQIMKSGDPRQYVDPGTGVFNAGILGVPPTLPSGSSITNVNTLGGPGNQSYPIGGAGPAANNVGQLFGSLPRDPGLRGPFQQQWDAYVEKAFSVRENMRLRFRGEFFNLFNHTVFAAPSAIVGSPSFGRYTSTVTAPRIIQLGGRFEF